jgi:glycerophosphoryl diester phosphodiesterase
VKAAHRGGHRVCCWTPNDPARVAELAAWGVDTIITDAVDQIPADAHPPAGD